MHVTCVFENGAESIVEAGLNDRVRDLKAKACAPAFETHHPASPPACSAGLQVILEGHSICSDDDAPLSDLHLEDGGRVSLRSAFPCIAGPAEYRLRDMGWGMGLSPCGRWAAVALGDDTVDVWSTEGAERTHGFPNHSRGDGASPSSRHRRVVDAICFSPCGSIVVTAAHPGAAGPSIRSYSLDTGLPLASWGTGGWFCDIAVSSCGTRLLAATRGHAAPRCVKVWCLHTAALLDEFPGHARCLALPDGKALLYGLRGAEVVDLSGGAALPPRALPGFSAEAAAAGGGVVVALRGGGTALEVWDVESGSLLQAAGHAGCVLRKVAVSPDGRWVVGADGSAVHRWDTHRGMARSCIAQGVRARECISVSPCSMWVFLAGGEKAVRVIAMQPEGCEPLPAAC